MSTELHTLPQGVVRDLPRRRSAAVEIALTEDAELWDELLARAPFPHLPQSYAYGEAKAATNWTVRRALFRLDGKLVAFATVLERRMFGLRLATRVNRGPVFLDAAMSAANQRLVFAALRRRWRGPLLIAPTIPFGESSDAILRGAGYFRRQLHGWRSARIDLTLGPDAIWKGFSSGFRNRARHAEKSAATLRVADDNETYEWLIARHVENMRDKNFQGPSPDLLRALRRAAPGDVKVFQMLVGETPVAAMSVVRFGRHAEYHVGWFGPEGRQHNAGNYLMWNITQYLCSQGLVSFDVGGMRPGDGYTRFKATMNPVAFELNGEWVSV